MTHFLKNGATYRVAPEQAIDIQKTLPVGSYLIKQDLMGFYLEMIDSFEPIKKIYGDCMQNAYRILNTFQDRQNTTGAMMTGEKGSGKTLLAKMISIEGAKLGYPTLIINQAFHGDGFNKLLHDISQPTIILFDEFEKVYYEDEHQEAILTLLDGVFPSKKLFLFTCNNKWRINEHMRNRPGRIYYMLDFEGLDKAFIVEYCENNLKKALKKHIIKICEIVAVFDRFNFDMLKALVEEMNRYDESPAEALRMINAKPEYGASQQFVVTVTPPDSQTAIKSREWNGNPLMGSFGVSFRITNSNAPKTDKKNGDDVKYHETSFNPSDLRTIDHETGMFHYQNEAGYTAVLSKKVYGKFDYSGAREHDGYDD